MCVRVCARVCLHVALYDFDMTVGGDFVMIARKRPLTRPAHAEVFM